MFSKLQQEAREIYKRHNGDFSEFTKEEKNTIVVAIMAKHGLLSLALIEFVVLLGLLLLSIFNFCTDGPWEITLITLCINLLIVFLAEYLP